MQLEGKVAAITGASRGMGAAFAKRFVDEGASVSLVARDADRLGKIADAIDPSGERALAVRGDVTQADDVARYADATIARFGHADILVNNAGALAFGSFLDESDEQWQDMLDVNLNSARLVTRALLPSMIERGGGKVIFISSNAAKKGFKNDSGYSVAKAGLMALTRVLAVEYGTQGIETFCVHPGLVAETELGAQVVEDHLQWPEFEGDEEKFWAWANPLSPTGFHPSIKEIEDLVTYLASPGSLALTGSCLTADHGLTPY